MLSRETHEIEKETVRSATYMAAKVGALRAAS